MKKLINQSRQSGGSISSAWKYFLAVTAAITCLVSVAHAADAITSKVDVTQATKQFTGDEWRAISLSANRILMHVDNALNALSEKKNDDASANINKGLTLVKLLDGVLPGTTVTTVIAGGGVTYQDEDQIKPAFAPIYREYDSVDIVSPVAEQKQAKTSAKPATAPEETYAGSDYTGMKLDLRLARRDLLAAQDLMKSGDTAAAKLALQDIEQTGVIFVFSETQRPLVRAMDNLRMAESELKNNHPDQVKIALQGAADALKNYEALVGGTHSTEVQKLQEQIDGMAKKLPQQTPEDFSKKISDCWNHCRAWLK